MSPLDIIGAGLPLDVVGDMLLNLGVQAILVCSEVEHQALVISGCH